MVDLLQVPTGRPRQMTAIEFDLALRKRLHEAWLADRTARAGRVSVRHGKRFVNPPVPQATAAKAATEPPTPPRPTQVPPAVRPAALPANVIDLVAYRAKREAGRF
jgi:hypothetical protein